MALEKVRRIISEYLEYPMDKIGPETRIVEDLGADSLDIVEIIAELENIYGFLITEEYTQDIQTVGDIAGAVERLENLSKN